MTPLNSGERLRAILAPLFRIHIDHIIPIAYTVLTLKAKKQTAKLTSVIFQKNVSLSYIIRWLVGCFGFNGPLRQYFSLYRAVSQRERDRGEKG